MLHPDQRKRLGALIERVSYLRGRLSQLHKGEGPGHPFRGNQYTEGESDGAVFRSLGRVTRQIAGDHGFNQKEFRGERSTEYSSSVRAHQWVSVDHSDGSWIHVNTHPDADNIVIASGRKAATLDRHLSSWSGRVHDYTGEISR